MATHHPHCRIIARALDLPMIGRLEGGAGGIEPGDPVIVDADTGFGNALNTQRTVREFERAGAAMIQLEDQTFPKRCGHLDGKGVVPVAEMCGKLRAALDALT